MVPVRGIKSLIKKGRFAEAKKILAASKPAELALGWPGFGLFERIIVFNLLPESKAEAVFKNLDFNSRFFLFGSLTRKSLSPLLEAGGRGASGRIFKNFSKKSIAKFIYIMDKRL